MSVTAHDYIIDIVHHLNVLIKMHIFRWRWLSLLQRRGGVECPFVVRPWSKGDFGLPVAQNAACLKECCYRNGPYRSACSGLSHIFRTLIQFIIKSTDLSFHASLSSDPKCFTNVNCKLDRFYGLTEELITKSIMKYIYLCEAW